MRGVLLLGPNGQLGSDIRHAYEKACPAFYLDPLSRDQLDVTDSASITRVLGESTFDVLVNCTGYHKTDEVEDQADRAFSINAHAVKAMAEVCAMKRARFVHISTDYVFGGDVTREHPLAENEYPMPVNVYGASKAMGEVLARLVCEETVILRVASLFGIAGASGKGGNFVETMIRVGREKGALRVVNDQVMSPTATADIADIIINILVRGAEPGIYHVVNSGEASWFEFAQEIIRRSGVAASVTPCTTTEFAPRAARPRYSVLDNGKISAAFAPVAPWQDALDRYLHVKGHLP